MKENRTLRVTFFYHRVYNTVLRCLCMLLTGTVSRITEQASITLTVSCTGLVLSCLDTSICVIFASFLSTVQSSSTSSFKPSVIIGICRFRSYSLRNPTLAWTIIAYPLPAHTIILHRCLFLSIFNSTRFSHCCMRARCCRSSYCPQCRALCHVHRVHLSFCSSIQPYGIHKNVFLMPFPGARY